MATIDKSAIDAAENRRAEKMMNAGVASASLLRKRDPKQCKVLEDAGGKITVALFLGGPFLMEMAHGRVIARHQQSIWLWDGAGILRNTPIQSWRIGEFFDEEELAQEIFDTFHTPRDVFMFMRARGCRMPVGIRI